MIIEFDHMVESLSSFATTKLYPSTFQLAGFRRFGGVREHPNRQTDSLTHWQTGVFIVIKHKFWKKICFFFKSIPNGMKRVKKTRTAESSHVIKYVPNSSVLLLPQPRRSSARPPRQSAFKICFYFRCGRTMGNDMPFCRGETWSFKYEKVTLIKLWFPGVLS